MGVGWLSQDAYFLFCFSELFEDLFFGVSLVGPGEVAFVSGEVFCDVFVCGEGEAGEEPFAGHVPVEFAAFGFGVFLSVSEPVSCVTEVILGGEGGVGEDAGVGVVPPCSEVVEEGVGCFGGEVGGPGCFCFGDFCPDVDCNPRA